MNTTTYTHPQVDLGYIAMLSGLGMAGECVTRDEISDLKQKLHSLTQASRKNAIPASRAVSGAHSG